MTENNGSQNGGEQIPDVEIRLKRIDAQDEKQLELAIEK